MMRGKMMGKANGGSCSDQQIERTTKYPAQRSRNQGSSAKETAEAR